MVPTAEGSTTCIKASTPPLSICIQHTTVTPAQILVIVFTAGNVSPFLAYFSNVL